VERGHTGDDGTEQQDRGREVDPQHDRDGPTTIRLAVRVVAVRRSAGPWPGRPWGIESGAERPALLPAIAQIRLPSPPGPLPFLRMTLRRRPNQKSGRSPRQMCRPDDRRAPARRIASPAASNALMAAMRRVSTSTWRTLRSPRTSWRANSCHASDIVARCRAIRRCAFARRTDTGGSARSALTS
jgi:hypothetical protein